MTLHSKRCSIKYIGRNPITTLYEKTCLSVCRRRQCPIERSDPLETDRGDPVSTETQKHRYGLCSTSKKSKFFQSAKQELINTKFKRLDPKKFNNEINNFFKDNSSSKIWNYVKLTKEVSLKWKNWSFRVLPSTLLQDENSSKTRGHYFGNYWQDTGIEKWTKFYERFKGMSGCWISAQWTCPRCQSTCVFPPHSIPEGC